MCIRDSLGVTECDLLIVLGARFSDRVTGNTKTFAHNAKILQIDVDAAAVSYTHLDVYKRQDCE